MSQELVTFAVLPDVAPVVTRVSADVTPIPSINSLSLEPVGFKDPRIEKGALDLGDLYGFRRTGAELVEVPASVTTAPAPLSPLQHALRKAAYLGLASAAVLGLGSLAACSSGGGNTSGNAPAATASPNAPSGNTAHCVTDKGGKVTVSLTCVQGEFPSQVPPFIQSDERSVVTVGVAGFPITSGKDKGEQELNSASGSVIAPNLVLTAGHDDDILNVAGCDELQSFVDLPAVHGDGVGTGNPLEGLYDNYVPESNPTKQDTDEAIAVVGGSTISELPELKVAQNAAVPAGTLAVELSMQATTVGAGMHDPTNPIITDRQPDVLKLVALGKDKLDPSDTDFAVVGTYTQGQLSEPIEGSSGAPIIPITGPYKGDEVDVHVVGQAYDYTDDTALEDSQEFYKATGINVTEDGQQISEGYGFPLDTSQTIIQPAQHNFITCS